MDCREGALTLVMREDTRDRTWLVALAAALWGTDGVLRKPLTGHLASGTLVFWEHLIAVVVLVPWLPSAWRAWVAAPARVRWAMLGVGAGASAVATTLFTESLRLGDPVTPLVLQKLQPLVALAGAAVLLRERLRAGYWLFAVPALAGAWLMAFPDPAHVQARAAASALLAVGAAVLWGMGTVLGRLVVGAGMASRDVTVLRFAIGLPSAAVVLLVTGQPFGVQAGQVGVLVALALIPGLLGLVLYYLGLSHTAASRATLAELAFPVTATLLGVGLLGGTLSATQWAGLLVVVVSITSLGLRERSHTPVVRDPVPVGAD
jgi:drug/metabolite transporter, DME family